jgi:hypothetical protein
VTSAHSTIWFGGRTENVPDLGLRQTSTKLARLVRVVRRLGWESCWTFLEN